MRFLRVNELVRVRSLATYIGVFIFVFAVSGSFVIAVATATVIVLIRLISSRRATNKFKWQLFEVLPEIIDHIISGVQSGLSLNESLVSLSARGPEVSQPYFLEFREDLLAGRSFKRAISSVQSNFSIPSADQLFEALIFAKSLGGSELLSLLRQIGDFIRQDLALRREIAAKQGWIRNSAHLSASAPWILLLLLSAQPSTSAAFSTSQGALVLSFGLLLTVLAYLWMGRLSKMPESRRIFGEAHEL